MPLGAHVRWPFVALMFFSRMFPDVTRLADIVLPLWEVSYRPRCLTPVLGSRVCGCPPLQGRWSWSSSVVRARLGGRIRLSQGTSQAPCPFPIAKGQSGWGVFKYCAFYARFLADHVVTSVSPQVPLAAQWASSGCRVRIFRALIARAEHHAFRGSSITTGKDAGVSRRRPLSLASACPPFSLLIRVYTLFTSGCDLLYTTL